MSNAEGDTGEEEGARVSCDQAIDSKGEFIGGGVTGLVERLPNGDIVKTGWEDNGRGGECQRELAVEARIYEMLGEHPRLIKILGWDEVRYVIKMEYMANGTVKDYMAKNRVTEKQQLEWALQATEGVQLLHDNGVIHCDIGPHNLLLDERLQLKIADFGGSSVNGSRATVSPGMRYRAPDPTWKPSKPLTISEDLFSLGSVLYFLFRGEAPFKDLEDDVVEKNFEAGIFPDLSGVTCGKIVDVCWRQKAGSAEGRVGRGGI